MSDKFNYLILLLLILTSVYLINSVIQLYKTKSNSSNLSYPIRDELMVKSNYGYNSKENDILLNPYSAPHRDDRYFPDIKGGIPINVKTQGCVEADYRQVGILTRTNGDETILPLLGRPLLSNRDTWQFYTINDNNNSIKLPIMFKNKSCTSEYGCDNLYNDDIVNVKGYNDTFKVTVYDNNVMRYIPYL